MQRLRRRGAGGPRNQQRGTLDLSDHLRQRLSDRLHRSGRGGQRRAEGRVRDIPRTDIGIVAYTGRFNTTLQNQESMPIVETFKPRVVLPSHHEDETGVGAHFDMPVYPLGDRVATSSRMRRRSIRSTLSALCSTPTRRNSSWGDRMDMAQGTVNDTTFYRWDDVERERVNPLLDRKLITGDQVMLSQVFLKKGCIVPKHQHPFFRNTCESITWSPVISLRSRSGFTRSRSTSSQR